MSPPPQDRPKVILYPSSEEDVSVYLKAIRLASSVRNSMDAQKAGANVSDAAVDADSFGRHRPNFPPPTPASPTTYGVYKPLPILNQTSSAKSSSNTTKSGFVHPRDNDPALSLSRNTGTDPVIEKVAADTPTGVTLKAMEQHYGYFPLPEPIVGATPAPPGTTVSNFTEPIPIEQDLGSLPDKLNVPGDSPPHCQLYVTNKDLNTTFVVCHLTKHNDNNNSFTRDLASRQVHSDNTFNSYILAMRNTAMCEAPTNFGQRVACGEYDGFFALGFFIFLSLIFLAWIMKARKQRTQRLDEENGGATWPGFSHVPSTNSSEAKLKEKLRKAHQEGRHVGMEQYEPVAWRSSSHHAVRAIVDGQVEHDARPVAKLPDISLERPEKVSRVPNSSL